MLEVLAALSLSAAVGMRIALPLLLIGLLYSDDLWANVPLLSQIPPPIVLGVLVSWSLIELLCSKEPLGQRLLQIVQLTVSPLVGAIVGMTVARTTQLDASLSWILAIVGGLLAFVLHLVQVGWAYRLRGLPIWVIFIQDFLCVALVLLALDAPQQGGLIVLLLLWIAIRSSTEWRFWYERQSSQPERHHPRRTKQDPD
ncbi:MAG: DUF4126 domain-containing protein [Elainella sp. Prado103]|jgi:hypothetical protein|nr:DUF4126 domain-containing protein [Elainella sp. Prado103]